MSSHSKNSSSNSGSNSSHHSIQRLTNRDDSNKSIGLPTLQEVENETSRWSLGASTSLQPEAIALPPPTPSLPKPSYRMPLKGDGGTTAVPKERSPNNSQRTGILSRQGSARSVLSRQGSDRSLIGSVLSRQGSDRSLIGSVLSRQGSDQSVTKSMNPLMSILRRNSNESTQSNENSISRRNDNSTSTRRQKRGSTWVQTQTMEQLNRLKRAASTQVFRAYTVGDYVLVKMDADDKGMHNRSSSASMRISNTSNKNNNSNTKSSPSKMKEYKSISMVGMISNSNKSAASKMKESYKSISMAGMPGQRFDSIDFSDDDLRLQLEETANDDTKPAAVPQPPPPPPDPVELCLVNKQGYPKGKGKGPYLYVLCTIKQTRYEETPVYWMVTREDTGEEIRGDAHNMERITSKEGLQAAQDAAAISKARIEGNYEEEEEVDGAPTHNTCIMVFSSILYVVFCLPFVFLHESWLAMKHSRAYRTCLRHTKLFLNGREPYKISFRITFVNLIVLCALWYLLADPIQAAFLPPEADFAVAIIDFIVWIILVIELLVQVFIRPKDWKDLIRGDKAFTPQTAMFIDKIHLFVESVSLVFFVPTFWCLLDPRKTCGELIQFSFLSATVRSVVGPTTAWAFYGRFFQGVMRLRVFLLVRYWRNYWINVTFLKSKPKKRRRRNRERLALLHKNSDDRSIETMQTTSTGRFSDDEDSDGDDDDDDSLVPYGANGHSEYLLQQHDMLTKEERLEKEQEEAKIKASNIGTALMTVNSHRALMYFPFLTAVFPMLFLICYYDTINPDGYDMVEYLQAINRQVPENATFGGDDGSSADCAYLISSIKAWSIAMLQTIEQPILYSLSENNVTTVPNSQYLVSVSIRPPRCFENFTSVGLEDIGLKLQVGEDCPSWSWPHDNDYTGGCIFGIPFAAENMDSLQDWANQTNERVGNFLTFESYSPGTSNSTFAVSATFDNSVLIRRAARNFLYLEVLVLVIVLLFLIILRKDAVQYCFGGLRSMLRIIIQYAKDPLAPPDEINTRRRYRDDSSRGSIESGDDEEYTNESNNYETQQLVATMSKITDLLRKCWGIAGADIISENLTYRDGDFEVFNPTVPGKNVYALFAFAAITGFDRAQHYLGEDILELINDVASVLHEEVFRWSLGDSGQCNRNLGSAFFMVFRIGSVVEVMEKLEEATRVIFSTANGQKTTFSKRISGTMDKSVRQSSLNGSIKPAARFDTGARNHSMKTTRFKSKGMPTNKRLKGMTDKLHGKNSGKDVAMEAMDSAMQLSLDQIPGISAFADRAVLGMLKSYANINRDPKLRGWSQDPRLANHSMDAGGNNTWSASIIFGMDAGWAVEGAVGSEYKVDATYLSPHVNMASRMMTACNQYGVTMLVSEAVQELLSEQAQAKMRNLDRVTVKGSSKVQNIYTYDARAKGTYLFLYGVSTEEAERQAKNYSPMIWNVDADLKGLRQHITEDFEEEFNKGMKAYYDGDWPTAIEHLKYANELMVEAAMDDMDEEIENSPKLVEQYRKEMSDQPCMYLIDFMKSKGGVAPDDWDGWHPLMSK